MTCFVFESDTMTKPLQDRQTRFPQLILNRSALGLVLLACGIPAAVFSQEKTGEPQTVSIQREAITLRHPRDYYVPLNLKPVRSLTIAAPRDGIIHTVEVKPGDKPTAKAVVVRLDPAIPQAELDRAEAALEVAREEQKNATGKAAAVAKASVALAEADLKLANIRMEQTIIRAPFEGQIFRILTAPGEFVRAGESLVELGDTTSLQVEVPLPREQALKGARINLNVEEQATQATVDQVLPLDPRFEKLRDLAKSITSAVVILENKSAQFKPGQSVSVELIPRYPIAEVPTVSVTNTPEGIRKLQIVRENVIRDLTPQILGQIGPERLFVSAPFNKDDEIIVSTSQPLTDGTQVQPRLTAGKTQDTPAAAPGSQPSKPPEKKVSF